MPRMVPIPPELVGAAIRTSEGGDLGVSRGRLRSPDVRHPFYGVSAVELDLDSLVGLCRSFEPLLRADQYFSHSTAAALHGMPLPGTLNIAPLHIASPRRDGQPRRTDVKGHLFGGGHVDMVFGLPVIAPDDAWCLISTQVGLHDLVAAGDFLLSGRRLPGGARSRPLCTLEQLHLAARRFRGRRGARAVIRALDRMRTGVDSRMESRMRLLLEDSGVRELVIGHAIPVDAGAAVLHPDLAIVRLRLCFEYEGEEHRTDRKRFRSDIRRRERLEEAGWRVVRVTADDVFGSTEQFLSRVHRLIRTRGGEL